MASRQSSLRPSGCQLHPSGTKQDSAPSLAVQRGKSVPFGSVTGGISSRVCFKCFLFPLPLRSKGGQARARRMETGTQEQEPSQSPTAPGFPEVLHDTSPELREANGKLPPSHRRLLHGASGRTGPTRLEAERWLLSADTKSSFFLA